MSTYSILEEIAERQGWDWNEAHLLDLLCGYIDNQSDNLGFREYLQMAIEEGTEPATMEHGP